MGLTPAAYYVEVERECDFSVRYRNQYITHWSKRYHAVQYSNDDIVALCQLRIAVDYYGIPARDYMRYDCRGEDFRYVAVANCNRAGSTQRDCRGEKVVVVVERPWKCRSHDEYVQKQNLWMKQRELNTREREVSARELEVAEREREVECREQEARMREAQAKRRQMEADAARRRAEHDREVAEFERRRLEHEQQMAEYEKKKEQYAKDKDEARQKNEASER